MCHSVGRGHGARGGGKGGRAWSRRMSFPKMIGNFDYTTHVFSLHISQIKPFSTRLIPLVESINGQSVTC